MLKIGRVKSMEEVRGQVERLGPEKAIIPPDKISMPEEFEKFMKETEEYIAGGTPLEVLVSEGAVHDVTLATLHSEYDKGERKDPGNYQSIIFDFFKKNKYGTK